MQTIEDIPNTTAVQLDVMDHANLYKYISEVGYCLQCNTELIYNYSLWHELPFFSYIDTDCLQVEVVISLLPASCHVIVANACVEVLVMCLNILNSESLLIGIVKAQDQYK